jgi:hypothetical protein
MRTRTILTLLLAAAAVTLTAPTAATAIPVKLLPDGQIGSGTSGPEPGQFDFPESVAVSPTGTVYVAEFGNGRIQELTTSGEFVGMFGWEVNATKDAEPGATQAEKNVCTAASKDACKAGVKGEAAGQFSNPVNVTTDPASKNIYVGEDGAGNAGRVQELTSAGRLLLEIGHDVNKTKPGNVCTEEEVEKTGVTCGAPTPSSTVEHGTVRLQSGSGDLLAAGGPEDLLYVGEEDRVQEFHADGEWAGEIDLTGISAGGAVTALALDGATGDVYLTYGSGRQTVVHEFDAAGQELKKFEVAPRESGHEVGVGGLALDSEGHLAVTASEVVVEGQEVVGFGVLYAASTGRPITTFVLPANKNGNQFNPSGISFDVAGELFAAGGASGSHAEVRRFRPVNVAELTTVPAVCVAGGEHETDVSLNCTLEGEANPEGVSETSVWFEWGRTAALGERTIAQAVNATGTVGEAVDGLRPNETFYERLVGEDANVKAPETLSAETVSFATPLVAPVIAGTPSASFVGPFSAVLTGELNPENARTHYSFVYAPACEPGAVCPSIAQAPGAGQTPLGESSVFGRIATTLEAKDLEPQTTYRYQLVAENENSGGTEKLAAVPGAEGTFTTAPAPVPSVAGGEASAIGATAATVSGSIDPDGQPGTYAFELGVYEGAATSFGIVASGPAGAGSSPVSESLALNGLQPDTTYAFRISVKSGYTPGGQALSGPTVLFTTEGLPAVLALPASPVLVAVPQVSFPPTVSAPGAKSGSHRAKHKQHRAKPRTCPKRSGGHGRAGCRAQTRKANGGKGSRRR